MEWSLIGVTKAVGPPLLDVDVLSHYLSAVIGPLHGPLSTELLSGGRSNLTYRVTDGHDRWILRRPPGGAIPAGAHDVLREYRVMHALASSSIPVPRMELVCTDLDVIGVPFYLMDEIDGIVIRTPAMAQALDESTRCRLGEDLVDTLADLHALDYEALGLADLGRPVGYLDRQVRRWARQYQQVKVRELNNVARIVHALQESVPRMQRASIVHGDYRLDNVIVSEFGPARIVGVLDWEMATLGDPLADLATLLMFWDEPGGLFNPITKGLMAFPGFGSRAEVTERYLSHRSLAVDDIDWYLVFAEFKLAVILEQIHVRFLAGETPGEGFADVGSMVVVLLDSAMARIESSPSLSG